MDERQRMRWDAAEAMLTGIKDALCQLAMYGEAAMCNEFREVLRKHKPKPTNTPGWVAVPESDSAPAPRVPAATGGIRYFRHRDYPDHPVYGRIDPDGQAWTYIDGQWNRWSMSITADEIDWWFREGVWIPCDIDGNDLPADLLAPAPATTGEGREGEGVRYYEGFFDVAFYRVNPDKTVTLVRRSGKEEPVDDTPERLEQCAREGSRRELTPTEAAALLAPSTAAAAGTGEEDAKPAPTVPPLEPHERIELELFRKALQDTSPGGEQDLEQLMQTAADCITHGGMSKDDALRGLIQSLIVRVNGARREARQHRNECDQWAEKWKATVMDLSKPAHPTHELRGAAEAVANRLVCVDRTGMWSIGGDHIDQNPGVAARAARIRSTIAEAIVNDDALRAALAAAPANAGVPEEVRKLREELEREGRAHEQTCEERDAAEEAMSQAYYLVTGESPKWSNLFGHKEALEDIKDATDALRAAAKLALAPTPTPATATGTATAAQLAWRRLCQHDNRNGYLSNVLSMDEVHALDAAVNAYPAFAAMREALESAMVMLRGAARLASEKSVLHACIKDCEAALALADQLPPPRGGEVGA